MKNNKWLQCLFPALCLMLIGAVVTAALAGVNLLTKDTIADLSQQAADAARREVITADAFEPHTFEATDGTVTYHVATLDGATVGYVFTTVTSGKSAGLTVMTGMDLNGTITGIAVTEDNETAGYVDKVIKDGLLDRIVQKGDAEVDGTSNATRTSKGVMAGVTQALSYYEQLTKGGTAV